ncbi:ATP-grasp domain-containing protein [Maioricimonas sp. JC845]|uniref:carboxylate--amine ligase n=1 Tax=Maioricimonas sp. JC845 TaxID=3232138 RepID=UPI003457449A
MHGRSLQALIAARSLSDAGVEVIGCDETPMMALSFSRYVKETFLHGPVQDDEERFVDDLVRCVEQYRPDDDRPYVLMPINWLTYVVARHRERFEPMIRVAAPTIGMIERVQPKDRLVETARALGVSIPDTRIIRAEADITTVTDGFPFPALLKLCDGTGGIGIEKVASAEDVRATWQAFREQFEVGPDRPVLLQELVGGTDYCVTALCEHGTMRASMVYRNLQTFPSEHGFGVLRETVAAPPLVEQTRRLLAGLDWHGVAEVDFRWDGENEENASLIEVNPRFWGGLFQSVASGVDYPALLYQLMVEGHVDDAPPPEIGKRTRIPMLGFVAELAELTRDERQWDQVRQSLSSGWEILLRGKIGKALQVWTNGALAGLDPNDRIERIAAWFDDHHETESELLSSDDPLAPMGLLYVVGSLVHHGRLPEELSRSGK